MIVGHLPLIIQPKTRHLWYQVVVHSSTWPSCAAKNATRGGVPPYIAIPVFMHYPGAPGSPIVELCVCQVACVFPHSLYKICITPVTKDTFAK